MKTKICQKTGNVFKDEFQMIFSDMLNISIKRWTTRERKYCCLFNFIISSADVVLKYFSWCIGS